MKIFWFAILVCVSFWGAPAGAQPRAPGQSTGEASDLGTINNLFRVRGQFVTGENSHFYKFNLPADECIRVEGINTTTKIQFRLQDAGGGQLGIAYRDSSPPRGRHNTSFQLRLFPATYKLQVELSRRNSNPGTYEVLISRGC